MAPSEIEAYLVNRLGTSCRRLTFIDLVRAARRDIAVDRQAVADAVGNLLAGGSLVYVQQLGRTFLEISYLHGRNISTRISLIPETAQALPDEGNGRVGLRLSVGASFGAGDHPTTRLALQAIDEITAADALGSAARVLDVGTGSGILAVAALLLGAASALGLDIDPSALWEAKKNARINGLQDRMRVVDTPLENLNPAFELILANLRLPTLVRLAPQLSRLLADGGRLVVSGLRLSERETLLRALADVRLVPVRENSEQGWVAMVFGRTA